MVFQSLSAVGAFARNDAAGGSGVLVVLISDLVIFTRGQRTAGADHNRLLGLCLAVVGPVGDSGDFRFGDGQQGSE